MTSTTGRIPLPLMVIAIAHISALLLLALVLISPALLPFGPSLLKVTAASLNTTQLAQQTGNMPNATSPFAGVNVTLSNTSTIQVKPRAHTRMGMRKVVIRDEPAPPPPANATTAPSSLPAAAPPTSSLPSASTAPSTMPVPSVTNASTNNAVATPSASAEQSPAATGTSSLKMTFGPLGSCYWSAQGLRDCTPASLNPQYNLTALKTDTRGSISVVGLPGSLSGSTRSAIMLGGVIVLAITSAVAVLPIAATMYPDKLRWVTDPATEHYVRSAKRCSIWALGILVVLLLGTAVSLRFSLSGTVTAFNAANQQAALPPALTDGGKAENVGLHAQTGNAFGLLWIVCFALSSLVWIERRRARQADAVAQARVQIEAVSNRKAKRSSASCSAASQEMPTSHFRVKQSEKPAFLRDQAPWQDEKSQVHWQHRRHGSRSSALDSASSFSEAARRKRNMNEDSGSDLHRPAISLWPREGRPHEELDRADYPAMRHQRVLLHPVPGRKQDLPLYDEAYRTRGFQSGYASPQYF